MTDDSGSTPRNSTAPPRSTLRVLVLVGLNCLVLNTLSGCGPTHNSTSPMHNIAESVLTAATTINLYPSTDSNRLYIFVMSVGQVSVHLPLIFDTGSAGMTLYAPDILPKSMFNTDGTLIFPPGQSSIKYDGITVTNNLASREYGGTGGTTENGYLAYAQITFGDNSSQLTTATMPIFLYYSSTPQNSQNLSGFEPAQGLFGVDPLADPVSETALPPSMPVCSQQTSTPCYVVSVLKYLNYSGSLDAGFVVTPSKLQSCSPSVSHSCIPEPMLEVGLTSQSTSKFSIADLSCPPNGSELPAYHGPPNILGFPVCEKSIANGTVTISGSVTGYATGRFLFDSGTPIMIFFPSQGSDLPSSIPSQTQVLITLPSGFTYEYNTSSSSASDAYTLVDINVNNQQNHVGVAYFETNSFFIDYTKGSEGWK